MLENLPFNSEYSDFGSFVQNDQLYFASARGIDEKKRICLEQRTFFRFISSFSKRK